MSTYEASNSQQDSRQDSRRVGPYRLESALGQGGMGTVYVALHERLQRRVALKQIRPDQATRRENRERFLREARAAARLNHPAIVQVHDIFEEGDCEWIVMELAEGPTLAHLLRNGALLWRSAAELTREIADGLAAAHLAGILHRDLKPENIVVTSGGHAKILDFGLAKTLFGEESGQDQSLSRADQILGTPRAMSPEQAMARRLDARSDLFSLGSMLYEMLTGRSPFSGKSTLETLSAVCSSPHAPIESDGSEDAPPASLLRLIDRLLAKNPAERPASAEAVVDALSEILGEKGTVSGWIVSASSDSLIGFVDSRPGADSSFSSGDMTLALSSTPDPLAQPRRSAQTAQTALTEHDATQVDPRHADSSQIETILDVGREIERAGGLDSGPTSVSGSLSATRERRQATVLWCELGIGGGADPDELYEVLPEAQAAVRQTLEAFGAGIGNVLGHRLVAYLGYPHAQEGDARRAVLAALALADELADLGRREIGEPLTVRTGVHTGLVVVTLDQESPLNLGKTLDRAQEAARAAEAGDVVVSDVTRQLIRAGFRTSEIRTSATEAPSAGGPVFRIDGELDQREDRESTADDLPLIGRVTDLERLRAAQRRAREGSLQVAQVCGPAGIGKSRLLRALHQASLDEPSESGTQNVAAKNVLRLSTTASAYARGSALHPILDLLRRVFDINARASSTEQTDQLEAAARRYDLPPEEIVPLIAAQLGLEHDARYPPLELSPDRRRRRTHEAILALLLMLTEERPVILTIEDLHHADPSTLEMLHLLIEQEDAAALFLVLAYRPEIVPPWGQRGNLLQINLGSLESDDAHRLVDAAAGERPLPRTVREKILAKADGVPLFLEELTRSVLESDAVALQKDDDGERWILREPLRPLEIPATLRDSLAERLDRLGPAKAVAQLGAVIGREWPYSLLRAVSLLSDDELRTGLDRLVAAELLQRRGFGERTRYTFRQSMVRDAAYDSLLARQKREAHSAIAKVLRTHDAEPSVLARHLEAAGKLDDAVEALETAGRDAATRGAVVEATEFFTDALTLLERRPESPTRDRREMALRSSLGTSLMAIRGYAAAEVGEHLRRAEVLSSRFADGRDLFPVLWGLWAFRVVRADLADASALAERMASFASETGDDALELEACFARGLTHWFRGDPEEALTHLERGRELDVPDRDRSWTAITGQDAGVCTRTYLGLALWTVGRDEEAVRSSEEAIELARSLGHPFHLAYALNFGAWLRCLLDDVDGAIEWTDEEIAVSETHGYFWHTLGSVIRGWAAARQGDVADGLRRARGGLDQYRGPGALLSQTLQLSILAELHQADGDSRRAEALLTEGLEAAAATQELFWTAELHRRRGVLAAERGDADSARQDLERAVEIARTQKASRLLERAERSRQKFSTVAETASKEITNT